MTRLKQDAPSRSCTDVGAGDFVKVGRTWRRITSNTAQGSSHTPRSWTVHTEDGMQFSMWNIKRYAKAEDLE